MPNIIIGKLGKGEGKMKHIITDNSSGTISVITDPTRLSLKQEFRGRLPEELSDYKVLVFNENEIRRLVPILNNWLKNNVNKA